MFKKSCPTFFFFCLSFFCLSFFISAASTSTSIRNDIEIRHILDTNDRKARELLLVEYIINYYRLKPVQEYKNAKADMAALFTEHKLDNKEAFNNFAEFVTEQRMSHFDKAEKALIRAIGLAAKDDNKYLQYVFYDELGFLQAYMGNTSDAVYSFGMAKKQSTLLDDAALQVAADIDLSDIFYRNSFYKRSLFYLREAQTLMAENGIKKPRLKNIIYNNIAENYFRVQNIDSLKKYNRLIHGSEEGSYKKYDFAKHTDLYLFILQHKYTKAVELLLQLKTDPQYNYDNDDEQYLADSYYNTGMFAAAKRVVDSLLAAPATQNHPEIKLHLYELLGKIAENSNDGSKAAYNFEMALQQSALQNSRLTQVDNIWSQLNLDEIQNIYERREVGFKKERVWLMFAVVTALLVIAVITMFFSVSRQKRRYEKLLFEMKKDELHFINSHEVRRHLANILGLITVIKVGDDKRAEYLEAEEYLVSSTQNLDTAIKSIAERLDN